MTITDSAGRTVTIEKPLERVAIIKLNPMKPSVLILFSDIVVGVTKDSPPYDLAFFPELASVPSVGDRWDPNVEAILGLQPDAVFLFPKSGGGGKGGKELDEASDTLEAAGITVLRLALNDIATYAEEFLQLGYIFNRRKKRKNT